ncbi:hypothetical protein RHGRI_035726 [Rhododendron griersonianum]|uniref:Uncharacterized protein n=1 Tax=Rhododendron griersonianum TaxID=479676 RepID=A0AAV6HPB1_9ERIC|nr:hypothetical protein RHGRI_035726 [Rhododendron griersonianum]
MAVGVEERWRWCNSRISNDSGGKRVMVVVKGGDCMPALCLYFSAYIVAFSGKLLHQRINGSIHSVTPDGIDIKLLNDVKRREARGG